MAEETTGAAISESTGGKVGRLLKDSGRLLYAGVRAALQGTASPVDALDGWRTGSRTLGSQAGDLASIARGVMARRTTSGAERGVDLLLEQDTASLPITGDLEVLEGALEVTCDVAITALERGRALRVRILVDAAGRACVALAGAAHDGALDGLLGADEPLGAARAAVVQHGGDVWIERGADGEASIRLAVPLRAEPPPA